MDDAMSLTECFRDVCSRITSYEGNAFLCNEKCSELCEVHPVSNQKGSSVTACRTEMCDLNPANDYSVPESPDTLKDVPKAFKISERCVLHEEKYNLVPLTDGDDRIALYKCEFVCSWR